MSIGTEQTLTPRDRSSFKFVRYYQDSSINAGYLPCSNNRNRKQYLISESSAKNTEICRILVNKSADSGLQILP